MATFDTKHCWVRDLKTGTFLANSRESVRVMGVVTHISDFSMEDKALLHPLMKCPNWSSPIERPITSVNNRGEALSQTQNSGTDGGNEAVFLSVTIDDGTDSIVVCAPRQMIESPSSEIVIDIGTTYDWVLKLRQNSSTKQWFADTLIKIENPIDEHYRWMELSHHDQMSCSQSSPSSSSLRVQYSNLCHRAGFPTRRKNAPEVYRLIRLNAQLQREQQQQEQTGKPIAKRFRNSIPQKRSCLRFNSDRLPLRLQNRPKGLQRSFVNTNRIIPARRSLNSKLQPTKLHTGTYCLQTQSSAKTKEQPPQVQSLNGLLLKDLAAVLQKTQRDIQEMTEDLQMEGKIYQNERGEYLPL